MVRGHPNKDIRKALAYAELAGLEVVGPIRSGHRWGYVKCPRCQVRPEPVWSTPRVPEDHARRLLRFVDRHRHEEE